MAQGPVNANIFGGVVSLADTPGVDAAGRLRVSNPEMVFDSKQLFDAEPLIWDDSQVSGSGTSSSHSTATAATTLGVAASTAGLRVRQTFRRINYQPSKSQKIEVTGVLRASGGGAGITSRIGYFDEANGLFFQDSAGVVSVGLRTSTSGAPVTNLVAQSLWNTDRLDGNGPSGITLDVTKVQLFVIDFIWLGIGRVRYGFKINGEIIIVHELNHANLQSVVFMSNPNQPVRYEISNDGTGAASTMVHICSSVSSEGGFDRTGVSRSVSSAGTHLDANTANTLYMAAAIRLKSARQAASVSVISFSVMAITADRFEWSVVFNPTIAGAVTWVDETNSSIQSALGVTANTVTGGYLLEAGWAAAQTPVIEVALNTLKLGATIAGVSDIIALCVRPKTANADIESTLTWREER